MFPGSTPSTQSPVGDALGMLHPLLVHFPVALLLAAVPAEFLRIRRGPNESPSTTRFLVITGALGSLAAGVTGWIKAAMDGGGYDGRDLGWHKWTGVAVTALALLLWLTAPAPNSSRARLTIFRIMLLATAAIVCATGHFGAVLAGHQFDVKEFLKGLVGG